MLDALRDGIFEDAFDRIASSLPDEWCMTRTLRFFGMKQINWAFFVRREERTVESLEIWFYSHYMLTFDLGLGLFLLLLPWRTIFSGVRPDAPHSLKYWLTLTALVLFYDALRLRHHVADLSSQQTTGS